MFRKFFSLMFLVSVIFFSGQAIDTPRIEALNYGNDGSRYEVINDYYVFSRSNDMSINIPQQSRNTLRLSRTEYLKSSRKRLASPKIS